jgi:broad specificity phosphatase PhoE
MATRRSTGRAARPSPACPARRVGLDALRGSDVDAVVVSHGGPLRIAMALALRVLASTLGPVGPGAIVRLPVGADR